jgi:hypothetical protein
METLFQNGSATRQPDPEKIQVELYEQLGRLQMGSSSRPGIEICR